MSAISRDNAHENLTVLMEALKTDSGLLSIDSWGEKLLVLAEGEPNLVDRTLAYVTGFVFTAASSASSTFCKSLMTWDWDPKKQVRELTKKSIAVETNLSRLFRIRDILKNQPRWMPWTGYSFTPEELGINKRLSTFDDQIKQRLGLGDDSKIMYFSEEKMKPLQNQHVSVHHSFEGKKIAVCVYSDTTDTLELYFAKTKTQ